ncbi:Protein SPT3 [Paramyrothecium foliicola]|nr:Protein SPT3 [Paramyrothecium foliicola]
MNNDRAMFKQEIQQMMYVAGETQDPPVEVLVLIEDIVHQQVVDILRTADNLAHRRGNRLFTNNDIIFQFRHDKDRMDRLRTFLTWKAIRKTVKDSDEKDGLMDDAVIEAEEDESQEDAANGKPKVPTVSLPWDVESFFSVQLPSGDDGADVLTNEARIRKLQKNDERTQNMTTEEYVTWSEYRHASFTWRKTKRFREWSGLGIIAEYKPTDDVLDILGFLVSEMVQNITVEALEIQEQEHRVGRTNDRQRSGVQQTVAGLFTPMQGTRQSVQARHIHLAFQSMQGAAKKRKFSLNGRQRFQFVG